MALRPIHEQLLNHLSTNSLIQAALLMDNQGRIQGSRGSSSMIRTGSPSIQVSASLQQTDKGNGKENVFLLEIESAILVVVFQDGVDFERVRKLTFTVLEQLSITVLS